MGGLRDLIAGQSRHDSQLSKVPLPDLAQRSMRATLIANTYLEAEIERLTEAVSTGFARGRMRKATQRVNKI